MISRDQRCVYVVDNFADGGLVVALLGEEGIEAEIINSATLGGLEGVASMAPRAGIKGMEVWVHDLAKVEPAKQILEERFEQVRSLRAQREARTGTIDAACEECGRSSTFPASQGGTVQDCPYCQKYMDVPDPDDEWDQDFGTPEDEP